MKLEALSPDGQVVFLCGSLNVGAANWVIRAITTPGGPVYDVGYYTGHRVVWAGDRFLLLSADLVYELGR